MQLLSVCYFDLIIILSSSRHSIRYVYLSVHIKKIALFVFTVAEHPLAL
jgi:hypothetical protein